MLETTAQRADFRITGRYDEAISLCLAFEAAYDDVHCDTIGTTAEGRRIVALRIARSASAPYVYFEGGIHAGEIEGKDAGFWFLRDLLDGKVAPGALDHVSVLFVPVINPDGHERWGKNNRPNQRGPEEMGFRTTSERLNLNRDWVKAESAEVRAVLALFDKYDPLVFADLHTTDGAKFETDLSVTMSPQTPRPDGLSTATTALSAAMMTRLTELGHIPIDFYPSFNDDSNPHSGFSVGEAPPRFGVAYMAARNRIGLLVETHSWRTYKERVLSTYHAMQALTEYLAVNGPALREAMTRADATSAALAGTEVTLTWKTDESQHRDIAFRGYAYERTISDLTGGVWLRYDETRPEIWTVPLFAHVLPGVTVTAPKGGYYVDGGFVARVQAVLDRHGIAYTTAPTAAPVRIEAFRAEPSTVPANSVVYRLPLDGAISEEGHTKIPFTGAWKPETRTLSRNAIYVPIAQPKARLVMQLLEPTLPDSLAVQGMFNIVLEQKEYAEDYVLEEQARAMFAADPALAEAFAAYAASAPAPTPAQKLMWIYRRTPAWDERYGLFPVYRTSDVALPR